MIEEDGQFVGFNDSSEDLTEVLRESELLNHIKNSSPPDQQKQMQQELIKALRVSLEAVKDMPVNKGEAQGSFVYGNKHYNLHKLVFTSLELGTAVIATVILAPALGGAALAGAIALPLLPLVISKVSKLGEIVNSLSDEELLVFEALVTAIHHKKHVQLKIEGATAKEIEEIFRQRDEESPDIEAMLKNLKDRTAIKSERRPESGEEYFQIIQ